MEGGDGRGHAELELEPPGQVDDDRQERQQEVLRQRLVSGPNGTQFIVVPARETVALMARPES